MKFCQMAGAAGIFYLHVLVRDTPFVFDPRDGIRSVDSNSTWVNVENPQVDLQTALEEVTIAAP
jgi:hypothetical protein